MTSRVAEQFDKIARDVVIAASKVSCPKADYLDGLETIIGDLEICCDVVNEELEREDKAST